MNNENHPTHTAKTIGVNSMQGTEQGDSTLFQQMVRDAAIQESETKSRWIGCRKDAFSIKIPKTRRVLPYHDANALKAARKQKGLTQQQTADKAKIAMRYYQQFEGGTRNLYSASFKVTMGICLALDILPDLLQGLPKPEDNCHEQ